MARAHARRQVVRGELPEDLVVGRWWATSGEACEVDVLGLRGNRTALIGEAKWQVDALGVRELEQLRRKTVRVPRAVDEPIYVLWGREGASKEAKRAGARGFSLEAMLG